MNENTINIEREMKKEYEYWLDKWAKNIIEREKRLKRKLKVLRTESGLGASGFPHVGSFGDVVREYGVTLALRDQGFKSEVITYADDRDGLRKVPLGLPNWLEEHIGKPVTDIPDPFGDCHKSFGHHFSTQLEEAINFASIDHVARYASIDYRKGILNKQIETILLDAKVIGEIIKRLIGQEKFIETLPYLPVCENCGRIYTTRAYELIPEKHKVRYICDQEFKGKNLNTGKEIIVRGCGHKGEASYFNGNGKLSWKVEFAARWDALQIVFEAHGKELIDSVRVNDEVCRRILNWEPPLHFIWELFLEKGGRKISKSIGNVLTPQVWFRYATVPSLNLLMYRRSETTREIDVLDIPRYMDDFHDLEKVYFGMKKVENKRELANERRLFEYIHFLKPPKITKIHIPYRVMLEVARILPGKNQLDFVLNKLKGFGYLKKEMKSDKEKIKMLLEFARNWVDDFEKPEVKAVKIGERERSAVRDLVDEIEKTKNKEELQTKIFAIAQQHKMKPAEFFQLLYQILLKQNKGPRLGHYIFERGKSEVIKILKDSLR